MKYKNVLYTAVISTLCLGITSCSDFLDEMPVNRTELVRNDYMRDILELHLFGLTMIEGFPFA